jgi:uncharacterized repeat protein (TIGR03803 family)
MTNQPQLSTSILTSSLRRTALAALCALAMIAMRPAQAQTLTVLHNFTRGQDGANPWGGLTIDRAGNLYGTATQGGSTNCQGGCGTVFELSQRNAGWTLSPLYVFNGAPDGAYPEGRLIFGSDGRLYGTTGQGGLQNQNGQCQMLGCGTILALRPPVTFCHSVTCYWTEQQLYQFTGNSDGARPTGDTVFDQAGNLYGTTYRAGSGDMGTVYELSSSSGGWTETVIHAFNGSDGANPYGGLALDPSGNLYGGTKMGGQYEYPGVVFQLTNTQSGWTENVLHSFDGIDGDEPLGGLILDANGNVYGTTNHGGLGAGGGGKVFELAPSGGSWTLDLLYGFSGISGPWGDLVMDSSGAIYGTTVQDGMYGFGSVFKLTYSEGNWVYTTLVDFNGQDGANPHGSIVFDVNGNLYGTTTGGGTGNGVVWQITP